MIRLTSASTETTIIVMVQITLSTGRKLAQKRKLFKRMAEILAEKSGPASAESHRQSGGSCVGELVIRQRRSAIYVVRSYSARLSAVVVPRVPRAPWERCPEFRANPRNGPKP